MNCDKSKEYCKLKIWVNNVLERDKNCLRCGSINHLEAHHIQKTSKGDKNYFKVDSGVTLCSDCHSEFHKNVSYYYSRQQTLKFIYNVKNWTEVR